MLVFDLAPVCGLSFNIMPHKSNTYYYTPIPGSRDLVTSSLEDDQTLAAIESDTPPKGPPSPRRLYRGEWLGGAKLEHGLAGPWRLLDTLPEDQAPLEQALYLHLFRLSFGSGKNFCRVSKKELIKRTRLSDRRLNVVLQGLVKSGYIKPLHRNTQGTLYRVRLPSEVRGEPPAPGVVMGEIIEEKPAPGKIAGPGKKSERKTTAPGRRPKPGRKEALKKKTRKRPVESPLNEERFADLSESRPGGPGIKDMVERFFETKGNKPKEQERQLAVSVLTELLEDGYTREEIAKALEWYAENMASESGIERLPYHIQEALSE